MTSRSRSRRTPPSSPTKDPPASPRRCLPRRRTWPSSHTPRARRAAAISTGYGTTKTDYVVRTSDDYLNTNLVNQAGQDYYYQDGVFYILKNGQYYVIEPPIGALVTEIPNDYDEVEIEGRTYYQVEDTLYKATVIDGALYFEGVCNL